jgi:hypothetical protein
VWLDICFLIDQFRLSHKANHPTAMQEINRPDAGKQVLCVRPVALEPGC